jgi:energy-coupling factor transporter ATP-binding protein EcfA2
MKISSYLSIFLLFQRHVLPLSSKRSIYNKSLFNLSMKIEYSKLSHVYQPKGYNQILYFEYLHDPKQKIVVTIGPAGTGKTMLAVSVAVDLFKKKHYEKIIITRPVVSVEEDIGFLPGNLVKKMDPWTRPIMDIFMEYYGQAEITNMIQNNIKSESTVLMLTSLKEENKIAFITCIEIVLMRRGNTKYNFSELYSYFTFLFRYFISNQSYARFSSKSRLC